MLNGGVCRFNNLDLYQYEFVECMSTVSIKNKIVYVYSQIHLDFPKSIKLICALFLYGVFNNIHNYSITNDYIFGKSGEILT